MTRNQNKTKKIGTDSVFKTSLSLFDTKISTLHDFSNSLSYLQKRYM